MIRVSNSATGTLATAGGWLQGNNNVMPASYTTAGNLVVDNTNIRYSGYFTPSNATDECAGGLFYVGNAPATANDITCDLLEGTTVRASAVITFSRTQTAGHGPCQGWAFFKFATPYKYNNTTASTWRFRLTGANANDVNFRYALGATTTLAYVEVLAATGTPTTDDCLFIQGQGTVAGTYNATSITVDASLAVGTAAISGINISRGGKLTWGDSQAASYTLTVTNYIRHHSDELSVNGFEMGTAAHPLTKDYIQKIVFVNAAAADESMYFFGDSYSSNLLYNYTPPNVSIYGNYQFNQASEAMYKNTLASTVLAGGTSIVFTDDIGLRAGGGDVLLLGSTKAVINAELVTTSAYNPATKTATIGATSYEHASGAYVRVMSCNAVFESSSTYTFKFFSGNTASKYKPHLEIRYLETNYTGGVTAPQNDTTSTFGYIRSRNHVGTFGFDYSTITNPSITGSTSIILSGAKCIFDDPYVADLLSASSPLYTGTDLIQINDGYLDGYYLNSYNGGINIRVTDTRIFASSYGFIGGTTNSGCILKNVIFGSPVKNTIVDANLGTSYTNILYNNCQFNSDYQIKDSYSVEMTETAIGKFQRFNQTDNDHRIYQPEGIIQTTGNGLSDTNTGKSGKLSLGFTPFADHANSSANLSYTQIKAVSKNSRITLEGYMMKNATWGSTNRPNITMTSDDGVIDTSVTITDVDDTWEAFVLSGTVGANDTFIEVKYEADTHVAGAVAYFYLEASIVDSTTDDAAVGFIGTNLWSRGEPVLEEIKGFEVDSTKLSSAVWDALETDHTVTGSFGKCVSTIKKWVNILFGGL